MQNGILRSVAIGVVSALSCLTVFADTPDCTSPYCAAVKWYRDSAERNALYREIFLMAGNIIQQAVLTKHLKPHHWGVIFDIDETLLDNSRWDYDDALGKKGEWNAYAAKGVSVATPGAKELIDRIHAMGGYVDMVTNRKQFLQEATEKNLREQGLYFDQVLYYTGNTGDWYPDKNPRFQAVITGTSPAKLPAHKVIAWFGDNIQDMPGIVQSEMIKQDAYGHAYDKFGVTYFTLPNPMYGSWENNSMR